MRAGGWAPLDGVKRVHRGDDPQATDPLHDRTSVLGSDSNGSDNHLKRTKQGRRPSAGVKDAENPLTVYTARQCPLS